MHNSTKKIILFSLFFLSLYSSALYLLGFSFNGTNVYGIIDCLIPFERILCFVNGVVMFILSGFTLKKLIGEIKKQ
jgi:hypothetical protein